MGFIEPFCSSWWNICWALRRIRHYASVWKSKFRSDIVTQMISLALHTQFFLIAICTKICGNLLESLPYSDWEWGLMRGFTEGVISFPFVNLFLSRGERWFPGVLLCVGVLLFLRCTLTNMYNVGVTTAGPTPKFTAFPTHHQMCDFWPMSHLKLFWIDSFRQFPPNALVPFIPYCLKLTWFTRGSYLYDPFWVCKSVWNSRGKSFLN